MEMKPLNSNTNFKVIFTPGSDTTESRLDIESHGMLFLLAWQKKALAEILSDLPTWVERAVEAAYQNPGRTSTEPRHVAQHFVRLVNTALSYEPLEEALERAKNE